MTFSRSACQFRKSRKRRQSVTPGKSLGKGVVNIDETEGESRVKRQQSLSADHWSRKKTIRGEVEGMVTFTGEDQQGYFVAAVKGTTSA